MVPTDGSDPSCPAPASPLSPTESPPRLAERNLETRRLKARIKTLERNSLYHEEQSRRWERFGHRMVEIRESEREHAQELQRRGDQYKAAYLEESETLRRCTYATKGALALLELLQDRPSLGFLVSLSIKTLRESMPEDLPA